MSDHRYTLASLTPDYIRAGVGVVLTAGPLVLVRPIPALALVLGVLAALFVLFAARTAIRHATTIQLTNAGIRALGPLGGAIGWADLTRVDLRYYSTRRDRDKGWMQLRLRGGRRALRLDSSVDGFEMIAARAAGEARARSVGLDHSTRENLAAIGLGGGGRRAAEAV